MKVVEKRITPVDGVQVKKIGKGGVVSPDTGVRHAQADRVDISAGAQELSRVGSLIAALPEIRTGKVDVIKTDIRNGAYNVDSEKVAVRLIERAVVDALYVKNKS